MSVYVIYTIFRTLFLIVFNILVAYFIQNVKLFKRIGENTLYLCGSEYILKESLVLICGIWGNSLTFQNPMTIIIYTFSLLVVANRYIVPMEKLMIHRVINSFLRNKNKTSK